MNSESEVPLELSYVLEVSIVPVKPTRGGVQLVHSLSCPLGPEVRDLSGQKPAND